MPSDLAMSVILTVVLVVCAVFMYFVISQEDDE